MYDFFQIMFLVFLIKYRCKIILILNSKTFANQIGKVFAHDWGMLGAWGYNNRNLLAEKTESWGIVYFVLDIE